MILIVLWQLTVAVQAILNYGTAYRLTKNGGDNGVSLFGWFFLLSFAALVPGLGIYLWYRYKDVDLNQQYSYDNSSSTNTNTIHQTPKWAKDPGPQDYVFVEDSEDDVACPRCGIKQRADRSFCIQCGLDFDSLRNKGDDQSEKDN